MDEHSYNIESDGRTVWVCAPVCVARFGRFIAEVRKEKFGDALNDSKTDIETIIPPNWCKWKAKVLEYQGIDIPDSLNLASMSVAHDNS